jgi:sporulation integral membrane protein YtvI
MPAGFKKTTIDISSLTLIKVLLIIVAVTFLFFIRDVILIVFVALILASAFDPWVDWLQKYKIPRGVGILFIYLIVIMVLGGAVYLIIPPIVIEVNQLAVDFPAYWEKISTNLNDFQSYSNSQGWGDNIQESLDAIQQSISSVTGGVFTTVFSFFGGIISFFIILVIAFYMTVEERAMKRVTRSFMPIKYQPYFTQLVNRMQEKIGRWLRGQLVLSLIIFLLVWLGLSLLGVKYALVLALFAGVTELIPYLGPFIGAVPAVFIAFTQSPQLALATVILYFVVQMLENNIIVPKVMQKAVGLNPVITIVVILIGAKVAGVIGIILAVPVTTALGVLLKDLIDTKRPS